MAQAGFILTRHWRDTPQGTEVSFWMATDNGPLQVTLAPQESVAFIPADQVPRAQHILQGEQGFRLTPLALKDFHRQPVYGLYCRAHRQLMNYEKRLREGGVTVYEADVRPPERYLMERFITSPVWVEGDMRNGAIVNARLKPHPDYRPPLKWVSIDIETTRHGELYCIGLEGCGQRIVYMLGPENGGASALDFELEYVASRPQLLEKLNAWFANYDPDVIICDIKEELNKTCTIINSSGVIAGENKTLICYVNYFELQKVKEIISRNKGSFSTVSTIDEILR